MLRAEVEELRAEIERLHAAETYDLKCKASLRSEVERLRAELMLARSQLEGVLATLRQTYDRVRAEQSRALENKPSSVHSGMENDCEQDEGA
jgi:chromosome segregation ATPase